MEIVRSSRVHTVNYRPLAISGIILFLSTLILTGIWHSSHFSLSEAQIENNRIDLLQSGWNYMPGVTPQSNGLYVFYLGRAIVRQDGSPGQINPAVNIYGTHLRTLNDFTLSATVAERKGAASFRLYASPPIVQDEFRVEPKSLDFIIRDSQLTVEEWSDGKIQNPSHERPIKSTKFTIESNATDTLNLQRTGDILNVIINGRKVTDVKYANYFEHDLWFGLSTLEQNDSWRLSSLTAESRVVDAVTPINTQHAASALESMPSQALQSLVTSKRPNFFIGAATSLTPIIADDNYRNIAYGGNFGVTTTENALKWQFIHPQKDTYDFKEADAFVAIAKNNNLKVQGHTLVFGEANPQWVHDLPVKSAADKEIVKQAMIDHITRTVNHFKDNIYAWDVVNEPLADDDSDITTLRTHKWFSAMGEDYINIAFNAARTADPKAKLYINDFGLEEDGSRWDTMLALILRLKSQNVPIDGVGFEAHVYQIGDEIDPAVLRSHIRQLAELGLTSHISEMDVHSDNGTSAQAKQYADTLDVCVSEPTCTSWTTWGVSNAYNLYESDTGKIQYGKDFLWDDQYKPTPAVTEIRKRLTQSP
jgi:endo-1,4-beta-xylanase